ncbi:MAG: class I SAM-dependent methyltransferase [bacterium JZ-2024 1]
MIVPFFFTTSLNPEKEDVKKAERLAEELKSVYIPRGKKSLARLQAEKGMDMCVLVWQRQLFCFTPEGRKIFFHPGLAKKRIECLRQSKKDWMVYALSLQRGDRVVDAHLGLAQDALVISYITRAPVLGIEIHPIIATITREGLLHYPWAQNFPEGEELAKNIQVVRGDNREVLKQLETGTYDSVYFSPMFVQPKKICPDRMGLREIAVKDFVTESTVREGLRVARKRVVLKVNRDRPPDFPIPPPQDIVGGKKSYVQYYVYLPASHLQPPLVSTSPNLTSPHL